MNHETQKVHNLSAFVNQYPFISNDSITKKLIIHRLITENFLVFLLQYMGLMLSVLTKQPFPLWLSSGTACAFVFLRGYTVLPGIWTGSFVAYYFSKFGLIIAFKCATILTLQAQFLFYINCRYISPTLIFYQLKTFIKFILVNGFLTMMTAFILLIVCEPLFKFTFFSGLQWWVANFNGILILACAIITWDTFFPEIYLLKKLNKQTAGCFAGMLIALSILFILSKQPEFIFLFGISILMLTAAISMYYGWCGCIAVLLIFMSLLILKESLLSNYSSIFFLTLFLAVEAITGLLFAVKKWEIELKKQA